MYLNSNLLKKIILILLINY